MTGVTGSLPWTKDWARGASASMKSEDQQAEVMVLLTHFLNASYGPKPGRSLLPCPRNRDEDTFGHLGRVSERVQCGGAPNEKQLQVACCPVKTASHVYFLLCLHKS